MSKLVSNIRNFVKDLIMGDFNENQMVSAQIVGGLVSLIPGVDQVMDVRDVAGCLFRINKQGGFKKSTFEQRIDFGFAAFGVVPEIGSAFKTVFKPLYKQRKAAKGAFNGGVAMIEQMLGQGKGGAVKWVKTLDWAGSISNAIAKANMALESIIGLVEYLAADHWWTTSEIQQLALDILPGMKAMRGTLNEPITEAGNAIREFLVDMVGEHAADVVMAVATNGGVPQSKAGKGKIKNDKHGKVDNDERVKLEKEAGAAKRSVQSLSYDAYKLLDHASKGLMGEHIVDHYIVEHKGWGIAWDKHDLAGAKWSGKANDAENGAPRKLNDNEIPLYLCTPSKHVLTSGIDSAWLTDRPRPREYAIVEAKASMSTNPLLINLLGEARDEVSQNSQPSSGRKNNKGGRKTIPSPKVSLQKRKPKVMQMSHEWIEFRIRRDLLRHMAAMLHPINYSRHVCLVTPIQGGRHIIAMNKIVEEKMIDKPAQAQIFAHEHDIHLIHREFGEAELISAENEYKTSGKPKKASSSNRKAK